MSLVNDMLRDLDQRRAGEALTAGGQGLKPAPLAAEQRQSRWMLITAGLILLLSVLVGIWFFGAATRTSKVDIAIPSMSSIQPTLVVEETPAAATSIGPRPADLSAELNRADKSQTLDEQQVAIQVSPEPLAPLKNEEPLPSPSTGNNFVELNENNAGLSISNESVGEYTNTSDRSLSVAEAAADESQSIRSVDVLSASEVDVVQVQEALKMLAEGDEASAFAALDAHVRAVPAAHQSRETFIKLLLSRGLTERAGTLADEGLLLAPNHSGFKKAKARYLIAGKNYLGAAELLSTRAPEPRSDLEYHELLASAQLGAGDFMGAIQNYRQLLQFDGTQARWWYGFAVAHDRVGNASTAKQSYEQALKGTSLSVGLRRSSEERVAALSAQ